MATVTIGESKATRVVNIHEAKAHLSRLVEEAANGEPFIIAKAGKPMVKVICLDRETEEPRKYVSRLEFLKGKFVAPADIKTPFREEIEEMFYGKE